MPYLVLLDAFLVERKIDVWLIEFSIALFSTHHWLLKISISIPAPNNILDSIHLSTFEHAEELVQYLIHEISDLSLWTIQLGNHLRDLLTLVHI